MFETSITSKNEVVSERRIGKFDYSNEFLLTTPQAVFKSLFSKVIPVNVDHDYAMQNFTMTAFSEHFEPIEQGEVIPYYQIVIKAIKTKRGHSYYISFTRVQNNPLAALFS